MRILSDKWKEKVNTGMDVQYIKYADITLKDGTVLNLASADLWANGFSFEDSVSGDSSFDIGSTIINVLTLSINNFDGKYSDYDFDGAEVICYVGMEFDDGTTEKIRICTATVVEQPEDETVTIDLTCEDNIHKFDRNYSDSKLKYPATRGQIVRDACEICGVTLQTLNFYRDDYIVQNRPNDEALTFRQVLQWVAQIGCQWMKCDEYGRLCINWYGSVNEEELTVDELGVLKTQDGSNVNLNFSNSDGVLSADNGTLLENDGILRLFATDEKGNISEIETTYGFTPHHTDVIITGVKVTEYSESSSDNPQTYMVGTEGYVLGISGNKLIRVGDGQTIASIISEKCIGMRFRPFESECPTDVALEAGDSLIIVDRNGKIYTSLLTTTTLKPGSGQKIACNAKSAAKNSSTRYSQTTQAFVAARNMVKQEKTEREKALEEFGKRIDSATGVYTTVEPQENGSKIFYLHDKPTLAESKAIWKMTSEAWGVSTDGGQTWNGGMTVDGDTIVRILNAVGVNAEWINAGAITVKDSNGNLLFQVDMDTKKVYISGDCVLIGAKTVSEALADNLEESKKYSDEVALKAQNMTLQLSNDIQTIATDADGNITDFPTVSTKATVMYGSSDITNDCSYTITKSDSITGSWSDATHIYNVTGLSADNGWIDIKATYLDNLSVAKRFTVSKIKAGAQGIPGRTYILEPSCNVLKRGSDKVISPNFLEFKAYYRDGNEAERHPYSGRFVVEETADGTTWNTIYTSSSDENTVKHYLYTILTDETGQTITDGNGTTIGIPRDITNIRCRLYQAGGTVNMYDMQSVAVVLDVDALTQTEIVKILTDDGKWNGLYYKNGRLFISFSAALGGELSLGGVNNGNGILKNYDKNGNLILSLENRGLLYGDDLNNKELKFINPNKNGLRLSEWDGAILSYLDIGIYWYESDGYYVTEIMAESQIEFYLANGIDSKTNPYTPIVSDYYYTTIYNSFRCYKGEATLDNLTVNGVAEFKKNDDIEIHKPMLLREGCSVYKYPTVTTGYNAYINMNTYQISKFSSSSKRYKVLGGELSKEFVENLYGICPRMAKYKDGYIDESDERNGVEFPMFIAEDVEKYFPLAVDHINGKTENWNERIMIPAMFAMIKKQKTEIDSLKQEIQEIKKLIRKE
jgi:hypothetical protein|nr:MAG TPA: Receptor recognition protein, Long tail, Helical sandwich, Tail fiber [Caudoviricetes sp.]